jgi:hypothetical protein
MASAWMRWLGDAQKPVLTLAHSQEPALPSQNPVDSATSTNAPGSDRQARHRSARTLVTAAPFRQEGATPASYRDGGAP